MKIHLKFDGQVVTATLADTAAALAFIAMLPVRITLHELFGREKFGALPRPVGPAPLRSQACTAGDLICWSAGPDLAVLYGQEAYPLSGGFHLLGRIDEGAQAFAVPGPLDVSIELADRRGSERTRSHTALAG
ncbi:hypothetical protein GT347_06790 [Xylophilus rhododendri]|uniref:Cyclophilin-like domain-containing protein n=1 Tax=Xylophilus rhododendri TaxID=2697032 RepID=A0A857J3U2_9BURK|nr:cyclophilin-like fold protein [Xylophilus rhododendri]QHI97722.1 hypothetical protein GT347_06790 [Xylophilus rhododendri]